MDVLAVVFGGSFVAWFIAQVVWKVIERRLFVDDESLTERDRKWMAELPALSEEERGWIKELYQLHSKTDEDGIPLWYVPRSFNGSQEKILERLDGISRNQQRTADVLDRVCSSLEKIIEKQHSGR